MSELWFVGAGLGDERDLTKRGLDALAGCSHIFAEEYTSLLADGSLERLAEAVQRPVEKLGREAVEDGSSILAALDRHERVGFLVTGDPFVATTHVALRLAVERAGHRWRYVPNASVATAAPSLLGLQHYRFGRTVSLPFPEPGFTPTSPIDRIRENLGMGLHSLVLLDLRPLEGRYLRAEEALRLLAGRDPGRATFRSDKAVAVVARLGGEAPGAWFGPWEAMERLSFGPPLHAVVVPAEPLHFEEEAAVARWRIDGPAPRTDRR